MAYQSANNPDQLPAFPEPEVVGDDPPSIGDPDKYRRVQRANDAVRQQKDKPNQPQVQPHPQPYQKSPTPLQQQFRPQQPQQSYQQPQGYQQQHSYRQQQSHSPAQRQQQWHEPLSPRHYEPQYRTQDIRPLDHHDSHSNYGHPVTSLPTGPRNGGFVAPPPRSPVPQQLAQSAEEGPGMYHKENPLSPEELARLFRTLDSENKGFITEKQLSNSLVNGGPNATKFSPVTVNMMVRMFDSNRNGELEFEEFSGMWKFLEQWRIIFNKFDRDQSGTISLPEYKTALVSFQYRLSDSFVEFVFGQYDTKNESVLTFDIFMQSCITLKRITDVFKKYDDDRDGFINISFEDFVMEFLRQLQRMTAPFHN